jgi:hypothetical protein
LVSCVAPGQKSKEADYEWSAPGVSCVLLVVMGSRFAKSGKVMPAGIVTVSLVQSEKDGGAVVDCAYTPPLQLLSVALLIRFGSRLL